jgi:hypothetical protein
MVVETLVRLLFNHLTRLEARKTYGVQWPRKLQIIQSVAEVTCHFLSVNKHQVSIDFACILCMHVQFFSKPSIC